MEQNTNTGELKHWGIKGMKWGIRRYQYKDGSLTPAGKKRAAKMKEEYTALTGKRLIRKPTPKTDETKNQNGVEAVKKKRIRDMSDEEIKNQINRLENEKRLAGLQDDTATTGQKIVKSVAKDMVAPAVLEAGRNLIKDSLYKLGKEKLGLSGEKGDAADEIYKELKRESETMNFKYNIHNKKKFFAEEAAREKESKKAEKTKTEYVKAEKVNDKSNATSKDNVIIDAEWTEVGKSTVNTYRDLQLPAPEKRKD